MEKRYTVDFTKGEQVTFHGRVYCIHAVDHEHGMVRLAESTDETYTVLAGWVNASQVSRHAQRLGFTQRHGPKTRRYAQDFGDDLNARLTRALK